MYLFRSQFLVGLDVHTMCIGCLEVKTWSIIMLIGPLVRLSAHPDIHLAYAKSSAVIGIDNIPPPACFYTKT